MANWSWEGLNKNGNKASGVVRADTQKEARTLLRDKGIYLKSLKPPSILEFDISEWMANKGPLKSVSPKDIMLFTKQFSIMLESGVPIMQCLEILFKCQRNKTLKNALRRIAISIKQGETLNMAMRQEKVFNNLYCNLVKVGETGGVLEHTLVKLTEYMEKKEKIKQQIKSAMTYPAVVTVIGLGVIYGMMTFIVPQFVGMFQGSDTEIPTVTRIVMYASEIIGRYGLISIILAILGFGVLRGFVQKESGKELYDRFILKTPFFGNLLIKGELTSFCRTLSILLGSGIPLIDALDICIETISNSVISNDIEKLKSSVKKGENLTKPISRIDYFPEMISQMIMVGEQTGKIDEMLSRVSNVFEDEVDVLITELTKLIEPLVIVILGSIVAFILVAMYLPIFMSADLAG